LTPGITTIERRLGIPSLGVVPWLSDVGLAEEDSVTLEDAPRISAGAWRTAPTDGSRALRVAVIALPYLANATDFAALAAEPSVTLAYAHDAADIERTDVAILPGTKDTLGALHWLDDGMGEALMAFGERKPVVGICGGYQMLGLTVADPHGVEGGGARRGLGMLPVHTVLTREKLTRAVRVQPRPLALFGREPVGAGELDGTGYEIHMGQTRAESSTTAFADVVRDGGERVVDGAVSTNGLVIGTYVHGLFASDAIRWAFVRAARESSGLQAPALLVDYGAQREARFDRLAAHVRARLDLQPLLTAASGVADGGRRRTRRPAHRRSLP
jgi:adenosylcobyric acid synthase